MASNAHEQEWKIRHERNSEFTPHDNWSRRIVNIGGPSTIQKPSDICEIIWFLFGPVNALQSLNADPHETFAEWVGTCMSRFEQAGMIPRNRHDASAFSLVTIPAWSSWYGDTLKESIRDGFVIARPRWVDPVSFEERETRLQQCIWNLVHMGIDSEYVQRELFVLPGLNGVRSFFNSSIWLFFRDIINRIDAPSIEEPVIDDFFFDTLMEHKSRVDRPQYVTNVNTIYEKMRPIQQAKLKEKMVGDHIFLHPPASKQNTPSPLRIPERICTERRRWIEATYGIFVDQFVVFSLNMAHFVYLSAFFPKSFGESRKKRRVRAKVLEIFMTEYEAGLRKLVLADLQKDLISPTCAYTRVVCVEEVQSWILHALELEYVREISRKMKSASGLYGRSLREKSAELCRAYSVNAMTIDDIAMTLFIHNVQLTDEWLNKVLDNWALLHGTDYTLTTDHSLRDDAPAKWLCRFKERLHEQKLIGNLRPIPSINTHLESVMELCIARYVLFCFHEKRSNVLSPTAIKHVLQSYDEYSSSVAYQRKQKSRILPSQRIYADITLFVRKTLLPCLNRCANPRKLIGMLNGQFLKPLDFKGKHARELPLYVGHDDIVRVDMPLDNGAAPDVSYPWFLDPSISDERLLLRYVINQYCTSISCYNWYEQFYKSWSIPNNSAEAGGITYAAQLDDLESQACNMQLYTMGYIHTTNLKLSLEEFNGTIVHVSVNRWPRYKKWYNVTVTWRAHVQGNTNPEDAFEYRYVVKGRVFYPVELACSIILDKIRCNRDKADRKDAEVIIECIIVGTYQMSKRVPSVDSTVNVRRSCIVSIPNF